MMNTQRRNQGKKIFLLSWNYMKMKRNNHSKASGEHKISSMEAVESFELTHQKIRMNTDDDSKMEAKNLKKNSDKVNLNPVDFIKYNKL